VRILSRLRFMFWPSFGMVISYEIPFSAVETEAT